MTLLGGGSFSDALKSGGMQALYGGFGGALFGGLAGGINSALNHQNFWNGRPLCSSMRPGQIISDNTSSTIRENALEKPADFADFSRSPQSPSPQKGLELSVENPYKNYLPESSLQKGIDLTLGDSHSMDHIFQSKHGFGLFMGNHSHEAIVTDAMRAANGLYPSSGKFSVGVNLYGYNVVIRGIVIDSVPRVGTMFILY